jgi:hypothetical protein
MYDHFLLPSPNNAMIGHDKRLEMADSHTSHSPPLVRYKLYIHISRRHQLHVASYHELVKKPRTPQDQIVTKRKTKEIDGTTSTTNVSNQMSGVRRDVLQQHTSRKGTTYDSNVAGSNHQNRYGVFTVKRSQG